MNGQYGLVAVKTILRTAILVSSLSNANARIPGVLLPHGDFAWDPTLLVDPYYRHVADQVALGSRQAAAAFANMTHELQINTFVLVTPHGDVSLDNDFGIYIADSASGSCIIGQDLIPPMAKYNLSLSHISLDRNHSQNLLEFLQRHNQSVAGIYPSKKNSATDSTPTSSSSLSSSPELSLNWAEIIPLSLLQPFLVQPPHDNYQFLILSMPRRRYQHAAEMVPELLHLGNLMGQWIQQLSSPTTKVGVVISGDLSHTHHAAGPYGYSWTSAPFDHALGQWAHHPLSQECQLVTVAKHWQSQALSCGFTGLVLWQGILKSQQAPARGRNHSYPVECNKKTDTKRPRTTRMTTTTTSTTSLLRNNGPPPTNIDSSNSSTTKEDVSPSVQSTRQLRRQSKEVKRHHDGPSSLSSLWEEPCLYSQVYVNRNVTYYGMMAATFWWE